MGGSEHWENVYRTKPVDSLSWFQPMPANSLDAIRRHGGAPGMSLIDVGGGASSLVAELARAGWRDLTVLDLSSAALDAARSAMGSDAAYVEWIVGDITTMAISRTYDIWHDRAVFHFLTEADDREGYHRSLTSGLKPGGLLLMGTFAPDGPEKCSGLPVRRYGPQEMSQEIGPDYELLESWNELHVTPGGASQSFNWCAFRKKGGKAVTP